MFSLQDFIMTGLLDAVGKMADYQVIMNATGWYEKGVLTQENLSTVSDLIAAKNAPAIIEEGMTENGGQN